MTGASDLALESRERFAPDSPLEGNGFELPVPGREAVNRDGRRTGCPEIGTDLLRNRRFESISLQQRVRCEPDFLGRIPSMTVGISSTDVVRAKADERGGVMIHMHLLQSPVQKQRARSPLRSAAAIGQAVGAVLGQRHMV